MLSLFIAFGFSACSINNDDLKVDCGANEDKAFTGFPLLCSYSINTLPTNPNAILVGSEERMKTLFTKHENSCPNGTEIPIDFSKDMLVGIFAGLKPTNGYSIKITTIVENKCEILKIGRAHV